MKMIVGLGNIGQQYAQTRHNIGFMAAEALVKNTTAWQSDKRHQAIIARLVIAGEESLVVKPTTMMNSSGEAVGSLAAFYRIMPSDIWVIYDELDLPLGRLKISTNISANGHNGIISIQERLGRNDFWRFRVGVDTRTAREIPGLEYVLQPFFPEEQPSCDKAVSQVVEAVHFSLTAGAVATQQRYNNAASVAA